MLKHIVLWKLKEDTSRPGGFQTAINMKRKLESMRGEISAINSLEVQLDIGRKNNYDICLIAAFANEQALDEYINHPLHKEVSDFINTIRESRVAIDFWVI